MKSFKKFGVTLAIGLGIIVIPCSVYAATIEMTYYNLSPLSWTRSNSINKTSWDGQKIKIRNAYTPMTILVLSVSLILNYIMRQQGKLKVDCV